MTKPDQPFMKHFLSAAQNIKSYCIIYSFCMLSIRGRPLRQTRNFEDSEDTDTDESMPTPGVNASIFLASEHKQCRSTLQVTDIELTNVDEPQSVAEENMIAW